jgi:hypothetical protein
MGETGFEPVRSVLETDPLPVTGTPPLADDWKG